MCAALSGAADAAGPGLARGKIPSWQQFDYARWPYDLPSAAGSRERDRKPPAIRRTDQRADATPYCRGACLAEMTVEPEPALNRTIETTAAATPSVPAFRVPMMVPATVPVPAARAMAVPPASVLPAPLVAEQLPPLTGQLWMAAAAVLLCAVLFVPGAVALSFFALAGFIVGGVALAIDLTWQYQVSIFAALGVVLVMLWARHDAVRRRDGDDACPAVGERGPGAMVGRVFQLEKPIEGGSGMLKFGGTSWRITGRDCAAGTRVKVLRTEGTLLIVVPVEC